MYDNEARECPFGGYRFELNEETNEKKCQFGGYPFRWWLLGRQEVK